MKDDVIGLIPVRLESTRLPGKALLPIKGIPAVLHTYRRAKLSKKLSDVILCTDSMEIYSSLKKYDVKIEITEDHINGSERIHEVAKKYNFKNVLNIQGDEILVNPDHIDKMVEVMRRDNNNFFIGITEFNKSGEKSTFKAVMNSKDEMLFCTREDIPSPSITNINNYEKVVFLVGYKNYSLNQFIDWGECSLERREPNEFLRILYHDEKIKAVKLSNAEISLDTSADLDTIKQLAESDPFIHLYID